MVIKEINARTEKALAEAFGDVLLNNGVGYTKVGVYEEDGKFHAFFETPDEKGYGFEWEAKLSIGHEPTFIAQEVLTPFFQRREQHRRENLQ